MEAVTGVLLNATEPDGVEGKRGCVNFAEDKGSGEGYHRLFSKSIRNNVRSYLCEEG